MIEKSVFAANVRQAIAGAGLTITEAAHIAGLGRDTVTRMLSDNDGKLPDLHSLGMLAEALGVPAFSLLVGCDGQAAKEPGRKGCAHGRRA